MKQKIKYVVICIALVAAALVSVRTADAAGITPRQVTPSNPLPGQTGVSYTFALSPQSAGTTIRQVTIKFHNAHTSVAPVPGGMSTTGAAVTQLTGLSGTWTLNAAVNGTLVLSNAAGSTPTNPLSIRFGGITNPAAAGTYYAEITTFSDAGTTTVDTDFAPFLTSSSSFTVTGAVNETLNFSLSANSGSLGTFSSSAVNNTNHTMTATTNASGGYVITGQGSTLTSGPSTIAFVTDGSVTAGVAEYGVNFTGSAGNPPGDIGLASSATVASRSSAIANDSTTATYRVSISGLTTPGNYSSTITYTCTASF